MSGSTYNARCNEITEAYYYFLVGAVNDGIIKANLFIRVQPNGDEAYFMN